MKILCDPAGHADHLPPERWFLSGKDNQVTPAEKSFYCRARGLELQGKDVPSVTQSMPSMLEVSWLSALRFQRLDWIHGCE